MAENSSQYVSRARQLLNTAKTSQPIQSLQNIKQEYQRYHAGNTEDISTKKQKLYKSARFANRVASLRFERYLPKKYQRAGKIARYGAIATALHGPVTAKIAGSAGTWAGLPQDDRIEAAKSAKDTVKDILTDPVARGAAKKVAKEYLTRADTVKAGLGHLRDTAVGAVAPVVPVYKSIKRHLKPEDSPELNRGEREVLTKTGQHLNKATNSQTPSQVMGALEIDPLLRKLYLKGAKKATQIADVGRAVYKKATTGEGTSSQGHQGSPHALHSFLGHSE